jgi:hypothetical protein
LEHDLSVEALALEQLLQLANLKADVSIATRERTLVKTRQPSAYSTQLRFAFAQLLISRVLMMHFSRRRPVLGRVMSSGGQARGRGRKYSALQQLTTNMDG